MCERNPEPITAEVHLQVTATAERVVVMASLPGDKARGNASVPVAALGPLGALHIAVTSAVHRLREELGREDCYACEGGGFVAETRAAWSAAQEQHYPVIDEGPCPACEGEGRTWRPDPHPFSIAAAEARSEVALGGVA